jgi:hypothetical protein
MDMGMSFFAMPLLCTDICPEKRDEANFPLIDRSLFNFIPFFGPCNPLYWNGHKTKKDIPMSINIIRVFRAFVKAGG